MKKEEKNTDLRKIIGKNLQLFIKTKGRTHAWVISKTDIPKTAYYELLNGERELENHIDKILDVFGIADPFYFHTINFSPPKTIEQTHSNITKLDVTKYIAAEDEQEKFKETVLILNDFINMIEILKKYNANPKHFSF